MTPSYVGITSVASQPASETSSYEPPRTTTNYKELLKGFAVVLAVLEVAVVPVLAVLELVLDRLPWRSPLIAPSLMALGGP